MNFLRLCAITKGSYSHGDRGNPIPLSFSLILTFFPSFRTASIVPLPSSLVLDDMLICAHNMAGLLDLRICDHNRQLLNESMAAAIRQKAKHVAERK